MRNDCKLEKCPYDYTKQCKYCEHHINTITPREALKELLKDKPNNKIACLDVLANEVEINEILRSIFKDSEVGYSPKDDDFILIKCHRNSKLLEHNIDEVKAWLDGGKQ